MAMSVASAQAEPADAPQVGRKGKRRMLRAARLNLAGWRPPLLRLAQRGPVFPILAFLSLVVLAMLASGAGERHWCCTPTLIATLPPSPTATVTEAELVPDTPPVLLEPGNGTPSRRASTPSQGAGETGGPSSPASPLRFDSAALQQQREARRRALAVSNGLIEATVPGLDRATALYAPADPDAAGGVTQGRRADQGVKAAPLSVPKGALGDPGSPLMQALKREGAASVNARIARGEFGDGAIAAARSPAAGLGVPPQQLAAVDAWTATTRVVPALPQRVPSAQTLPPQAGGSTAAANPATANRGAPAGGRRILNAVLDGQGRLVDLYVSDERGARVSITADCARYIADARSRGRAYDLSGGVCGAAEVRYPRQG